MGWREAADLSAEWAVASCPCGSPLEEVRVAAMWPRAQREQPSFRSLERRACAGAGSAFSSHSSLPSLPREGIHRARLIGRLHQPLSCP